MSSSSSPPCPPPPFPPVQNPSFRGLLRALQRVALWPASPQTVQAEVEFIGAFSKGYYELERRLNFSLEGVGAGDYGRVAAQELR